MGICWHETFNQNCILGRWNRERKHVSFNCFSFRSFVRSYGICTLCTLTSLSDIVYAIRWIMLTVARSVIPFTPFVIYERLVWSLTKFSSLPYVAEWNVRFRTFFRTFCRTFGYTDNTVKRYSTRYKSLEIVGFRDMNEITRVWAYLSITRSSHFRAGSWHFSKQSIQSLELAEYNISIRVYYSNCYTRNFCIYVLRYSIGWT